LQLVVAGLRQVKGGPLLCPLRGEPGIHTADSLYGCTFWIISEVSE
jgi:hypothetical protein